MPHPLLLFSSFIIFFCQRVYVIGSLGMVKSNYNYCIGGGEGACSLTAVFVRLYSYESCNSYVAATTFYALEIKHGLKCTLLVLISQCEELCFFTIRTVLPVTASEELRILFLCSWDYFHISKIVLISLTRVYNCVRL